MDMIGLKLLLTSHMMQTESNHFNSLHIVQNYYLIIVYVLVLLPYMYMVKFI